MYNLTCESLARARPSSALCALCFTSRASMAPAPPTLQLPPIASLTSDAPLPELPQELLVALLGQHHDERDALDAFVLGGGAEVEDVLNDLIPDGNPISNMRPIGEPDGDVLPTEAALEQTPLVSLLLRGKIQDIRLDIEELAAKLELDQDPGRLSAIQELIGVSPLAASEFRRLVCRWRVADAVCMHRAGIAGSSHGYQRRGHGERDGCEGHYEGHSVARLGQEEPRRQHERVEAFPNAW